MATKDVYPNGVPVAYEAEVFSSGKYKKILRLRFNQEVTKSYTYAPTRDSLYELGLADTPVKNWLPQHHTDYDQIVIVTPTDEWISYDRYDDSKVSKLPIVSLKAEILSLKAKKKTFPARCRRTA